MHTLRWLTKQEFTRGSQNWYWRNQV